MYDSDTSVTLKQGKSHQTWYELLDPKQSYNYEKFERPPRDSVPQKANAKVFLRSGNTPALNMCNGEK